MGRKLEPKRAACLEHARNSRTAYVVGQLPGVPMFPSGTLLGPEVPGYCRFSPNFDPAQPKSSHGWPSSASQFFMLIFNTLRQNVLQTFESELLSRTTWTLHTFSRFPTMYSLLGISMSPRKLDFLRVRLGLQSKPWPVGRRPRIHHLPLEGYRENRGAASLQTEAARDD